MSVELLRVAVGYPNVTGARCIFSRNCHDDVLVRSLSTSKTPWKCPSGPPLCEGQEQLARASPRVHDERVVLGLICMLLSDCGPSVSRSHLFVSDIWA